MANRMTGLRMLLTAVFMLIGGTAALLYAEEPAATGPAAPEQVPDIAFYLSPTKLIRTQFSDHFLNSPEWTDFFTGFVNRLNARHLKQEPASRLMNQLAESFPDAPRSMNGLLNLFFFNLQGIWGNFLITDSTCFEPADSFMTYLSDYEPGTVAGLTGALLDEAGYSEQMVPKGNPQMFVSEGKGTFYAGTVSPLRGDSGKSLFFLTRSPEALVRMQNEFPEAGELKTALSDSDSVFCIVSLTGEGLQKIARRLEHCPPESKIAALAPGIQKLGEQVQNIWFVMQETSGQTKAALTVICRENKSSEDLRRLFDESRELVAQWSQGRTLTPAETLAADLLNRMELIQEDERFYVTLNLNAPETMEKIKQLLAEKSR